MIELLAGGDPLPIAAPSYTDLGGYHHLHKCGRHGQNRRGTEGARSDHCHLAVQTRCHQPQAGLLRRSVRQPDPRRDHLDDLRSAGVHITHACRAGLPNFRLAVPRASGDGHRWPRDGDQFACMMVGSGGRHLGPVCGLNAAVGAGAAVRLGAHLKSRVFTLIGSTVNVGSTRSRGVNLFGRLRGSRPGPP